MAFYSTCAALLFTLVGSASADCQSYGVDYENGGTYFQNNGTSDVFTALEQFSGCANDTAHNVLIDPNGDQTECSATAMLPDNADQLITCDQYNNQNLWNGDWSLMVVSNNANESAIAFQRDFVLDVGTPTATVTAPPTQTNTQYATSTYYNTVTLTYTTTLVLITTGTAMETFTSTIALPVETSATPPVGGTVTGADGIATATSYLAVTQTTTSTPSCAAGLKTLNPDALASIVPSILGELDQVAASIISKVGEGLSHVKPRATPMAASAKFKREIIEGRTPSEQIKRAFVKERHALLHPNGIVKRHPDSYTTTVYSGDTTYTTDSTSYVATESYDYYVYETEHKVELFGRQTDAAAASTVTTVIPTTLIETVVETLACASA